MPAGCYMHPANTVRDIARDFTRDPRVVAQQYANVPRAEPSPGPSPPAPPTAPSKKEPNWLFRFFGAK